MTGKFAQNGLAYRSSDEKNTAAIWKKGMGYRSSDEEIQGSVWHFPFPSVEESKTTAGRTRHRNRYIDGNKPSRPLRIAAKSAVEESGSFLEQDSTEVP